MNTSQREKLFDFAIGNGNDKIKGNDYMMEKSIMCQNMIPTYCKYEYNTDSDIYQSLLSYLNSTKIASIMSKVLNTKIIGISDMFISIFYENNYLLTHHDKGLGQYAFVLFLSQNWDFGSNGGKLIFDCQQSDDIHIPTSCYEKRFKFNEMVIFQVAPNLVPHHVEKVTVSKPRIAITGWFFTTDPFCFKCIQQQKGY